jgi:hypothetical protein
MDRAKKHPRVKIAILAVMCFCSVVCSDQARRDDAGLGSVLMNLKGEPVIPREANKIQVSPFSDRTGRPGLAEKLHNRIRESISRDLRLAVVADGDQADVTLEGSITSFQIQEMKFTNFRVPEKKRMRITVAMTLYKKASGSIILHEPELQAFREFSDILPPLETEPQVMETLITDLARRITAKTVTGWHTDLMTPVEKGKRK